MKSRIIDAAFAVLERRGLDGLTVRRIAARLHVENPALYWHFKNKQQIIDAMAERMLEQAVREPKGRWDVWLTASANAFREALLAHRDGARLAASANLSRSPVVAHHHRAVHVLREAGFKPWDALSGVLALYDYALGATFEDQADPVRERPVLPGSRGESPFDAGVRLLMTGLASRLGSPRLRGGKRGRARGGRARR